MQIKFISTSPSTPPGPFRKLAGVVIAVVVAVLALMFSAVLLAGIAIVGIFVGAYWWWKTRELRQHLRDLQAQAQAMERTGTASDGDVFEGEVIRVVEDEKPLSR